MESVGSELESDFDWITGYEVPTSGIAILQHIGGPNDLVMEQLLELVELLNRFRIRPQDVTITCGVVDR
jgi:hypothetical protein